jgi:hypothetical protein
MVTKKGGNMAQRGRPKKEEQEKKMESEKIEKPRILTSAHEVAEELGIGIKPFFRLLRKYPFSNGTGVTGKLNGRWNVPAEYVHKWHRYVLRQETRHPDSRRMRPAEPPEMGDIQGR